MASKGKPRKKGGRGRQPDLEAIGLVLLALGVFVLGFLLPVLPTGELGAQLRTGLVSRLGWGAYALPWPALVLGSLFLLRRNPRSWPRALLGYLLLAFGLWALLTLAAPARGGSWGQGLRQSLAGAAGWLAYLPALFVVTLGLELMLGWQPTRILRRGSVRLLGGVRSAFKAALRARRRIKDRAAFYADVALARGGLQELDRDLQALTTLYPGSAELDRWRRAVRLSSERLAGTDAETLEDVRTELAAWQSAVQDFARDRAVELALRLRAEGVSDVDARTRGLKAQLDDPITDPVPIAPPLDDLRKALALDLTALATRHQRLIRERDLAEAALRDPSPRQLARISEQHGGRLEQYQRLAKGLEALEQDAERLEPWRDHCGKLLRLTAEFPEARELADHAQTLAAELRDQGRFKLAHLDAWIQALESAEVQVRERAAAALVVGAVPGAGGAPAFPITAADFDSGAGDPDLPPEPFDLPEEPGSEDRGVSSPAAGPETGLIDLEDDGEGAGPQEDLPAVGGIPIQLPGLDLLEPLAPHQEDPAAFAREVQARVRKIDETLADFNLQGRVVASVRGPTVTRFEVEPAPGEKISRFATLSDDLARAMAVGSVRIEAPIPGKTVIGLEVPNANRESIRFREAVESGSFRRSRARLPLILGKSIDGEMMVADLARMPHLLIAGSTGSGKSVAVNTLIGCLLYKFLPTELRFLMIDPKMVELTPFDAIPHLLRPVVTNPNDAAGVLLGAVAHMERRYKMMRKMGAKNLDQYNEKARNLELPELPFIIIIIDELADLMITSPKEVENAIMRLAQMARATGMHLILATQRPSVDILTSLIKVNVPARVAFAVSSSHDSRTILDSMGAERLVGTGDMLFHQPGLVKPVRLQGPYVSEQEITSLAVFLRRQYFDDEFVEAYGADFDPPSIDDSDASGLIDWNDDKLRDAAELVIQEGQGSVSRLQRRLQVGHARAGKLMDSLEAMGIVGPHVGSKPREVLVALEDLPDIFGK